MQIHLNTSAENLYNQAEILFRPFSTKDLNYIQIVKKIFMEIALYIPRLYEKRAFVKLCIKEISKQLTVDTSDSEKKLKVLEDKLNQLETLRKVSKLLKSCNYNLPEILIKNVPKLEMNTTRF